ncbi:MAG: putative aldouronate transport system substrate-binding protein, partial [Rhodothermales bacterium]
MHPSSRLSLLLFGVTVIALAAWLLLAPGRSVAPAPISVDWATVADDPGERLEISYLYTFTREIQPDSVVKAIIEARMNVTLDLEYVPMAVQSVRKPLQLIGGASPDIFMAEAGEIARYQEHGFLLPIPRELLASHCPTLVARMDRYAPWLWPGLEVDGVGYGCPAALWHEARYPRTGAWRKDLLEAVGIQDVPDTLAEFATAFERLHAAGQGCMTGDVSAGGIETAFTEIFCAFGVLPFDWMLRDDEIVYGGIQPGTRDALALLREWYAAGYIHPDFVTDRWWSEARSKFV